MLIWCIQLVRARVTNVLSRLFSSAHVCSSRKKYANTENTFVMILQFADENIIVQKTQHRVRCWKCYCFAYR